MFDFLELEETVGKAWHRLVGGRMSYQSHLDQAVTLDEVRGHLAVIFRALGGEFGVQLAGVSPRSSSHRLRLRQRLGLAEERLAQPGRDAATLFLPPCIDLFPLRSLNNALYRWLAVYFAHLPVEPIAEHDPLRRDLLALRRAAATVDAVLASCPGLAQTYEDLRLAMAEARPHRSLPALETEEEIVVALLAGSRPHADIWDAAHRNGPLPRTPRDYQALLPVPLWADAWIRPSTAASGDSDEPGGSGQSAASDTRRRFAARRNSDESKRRDPFVLNRFEKILAMAEMVNVNRPADDSDDENAEKAADEFEDLPLSNLNGEPATRLKFDVDLPPEAVDTAALTADLTYPEWD